MKHTSFVPLQATDVARLHFPILNATDLKEERADRSADTGICLSLYSQMPTKSERAQLKSYREYLQRERILPKRVLFQKLSDGSWICETKSMNVRIPRSDTTLLNLLDQTEGFLTMVSRQDWEQWKKKHAHIFLKGGKDGSG